MRIGQPVEREAAREPYRAKDVLGSTENDDKDRRQRLVCWGALM